MKITYDDNLHAHWTPEEYRRLCEVRAQKTKPRQTKRILHGTKLTTGERRHVGRQPKNPWLFDLSPYLDVELRQIRGETN